MEYKKCRGLTHDGKTCPISTNHKSGYCCHHREMNKLKKINKIDIYKM